MKLKASTKFHIKNILPAVIIFYIVMIALICASIVLDRILTDDSSFGGLAASSMIFLFVLGICSFTDPFRMFIQNSISRNELWRSYLTASVIMAAAMSAIDLVFLFLSILFVNTESLILAFLARYVSQSVLQILFAYLLQTVLYTLLFTLGYFIRLLYYRMGKALKIIVSISVPGFLLIVLPILSSHYNLEPIFGSFFGFLGFIMNPDKFYGLPMVYIFFLALFAIFAVLNKSLIKKAIVK